MHGIEIFKKDGAAKLTGKHGRTSGTRESIVESPLIKEKLQSALTLLANVNQPIKCLTDCVFQDNRNINDPPYKLTLTFMV